MAFTGASSEVMTADFTKTLILQILDVFAGEESSILLGWGLDMLTDIRLIEHPNLAEYYNTLRPLEKKLASIKTLTESSGVSKPHRIAVFKDILGVLCTRLDTPLTVEEVRERIEWYCDRYIEKLGVIQRTPGFFQSKKEASFLLNGHPNPLQRFPSPGLDEQTALARPKLTPNEKDQLKKDVLAIFDPIIFPGHGIWRLCLYGGLKLYGTLLHALMDNISPEEARVIREVATLTECQTRGDVEMFAAALKDFSGGLWYVNDYLSIARTDYINLYIEYFSAYRDFLGAKQAIKSALARNRSALPNPAGIFQTQIERIRASRLFQRSVKEGNRLRKINLGLIGIIDATDIEDIIASLSDENISLIGKLAELHSYATEADRLAFNTEIHDFAALMRPHMGKVLLKEHVMSVYEEIFSRYKTVLESRKTPPENVDIAAQFRTALQSIHGEAPYQAILTAVVPLRVERRVPSETVVENTDPEFRHGGDSANYSIQEEGRENGASITPPTSFIFSERKRANSFFSRIWQSSRPQPEAPRAVETVVLRDASFAANLTAQAQLPINIPVVEKLDSPEVLPTRVAQQAPRSTPARVTPISREILSVLFLGMIIPWGLLRFVAVIAAQFAARGLNIQMQQVENRFLAYWQDATQPLFPQYRTDALQRLRGSGDFIGEIARQNAVSLQDGIESSRQRAQLTGPNARGLL